MPPLRTFFLFASLAALSAMGCRTRSFHQQTRVSDAPPPVGTLRIPSEKETWLFTWTTNPRAKDDPRGYLLESLKGVADQNRTWSRRHEDVQAGYGIYFAGDPARSSSYGDILVAVKAAKGVEVGDTGGAFDPSQSMITSPLPGIVYAWAHPTFVGRNAFVARDASVLQLDTAKVWGGKPTVPFSERTAFVASDTTRWEVAVEHFADVMRLVEQIGSGEAARSQGENAFPSPLLDDAGTLNQMGVLAAIEIELQKVVPRVRRACETLYGPAPADDPNYSSRLFPILYHGFGNLRNSLWSTELVVGTELAEFNRLLQAAGYLPTTVIPGHYLELAIALDAEFRKGSGFVRAQEAVGAYRILKKEFGSWSLQNWSRGQ